MVPPRNSVPLGKPLELTDAELDEMSEVKPADIEKAKAFWRNTAPTEFETLLDALPVDEDAP